ncbi:MAG: BACON domain-containing protein [Clostridia bacterium]|nr:BACON domain-containing protein [Clostridia bacterium]
MRIRTILLVLLCLLLPAAAAGETSLALSMQRVPAESILDFQITGEAADSYRYTLLKDGKELFTTETDNAFGSYLPREQGEYTLKAVYAKDGTEVTASEDFVVVPALKLTAEPLPDRIQAGGVVHAQLTAAGGTEPYRYIYAVTQNGNTLLEEYGSDQWYYSPMQEGDFLVHMAVMDSEGAVAMLQSPLTVEPMQGITLTHTGGGLMAHGGQESWMVCSAQPWTATTDSDFFILETPQGQPGDPLVVTALSAAGHYREGSIRITSGGTELDWTVSQSAQHGVDEDVYLFSEPDPLWVDGSQHAVWTAAEGSRSFTVSPAESSYKVFYDADFLSVSKRDDMLTVTVLPPDTPSVRSGTVTLSTPGGSACIHVYQLPGKSEPATAANTGLEWCGENIYSQSSGYWKDQKYRTSTLEVSGCAIFALSHALDRLGWEGEAITPQALAKKYAFCLVDGGTLNSTLVGNAGDDLGFKTRFDLYKDLPTIKSRLEKGAMFSFAVVSGHIALVTEMSPDGSMMHIVDSAPSATWERIKNAQLYKQLADGSFTPITSLAQLDGIRYYPENNAFGGADYWLESRYVAKRGVRLIQPE